MVGGRIEQFPPPLPVKYTLSDLLDPEKSPIQLATKDAPR